MNEVKKKRIILSAGAVTIAVLFFLAGFFTGRATGKSVGEPTLDVPVYESAGGLMLSDDGEDNGVTIINRQIEKKDFEAYGVAAAAETAYTVTAIVSGDGLTEDQKGVTWSAAVFKNPSSEWATGKDISEYVSTSVQGAQITVSCLKAFGEQIVIKCTSTFNTTVSKDLTLDYKDKRIDQIQIDDTPINTLRNKQFPFYISEDHDATISLVSIIHSEAYTIEADDESVTIDFSLRTGFESYAERFPVFSSITLTTKSPTTTIEHFFDKEVFQKMFVEGYSALGKAQFQSFYSRVKSASQATTNGLYAIKWTFASGGSQRSAAISPEFTEVDKWYTAFTSAQMDFDDPYSDGNLIY